MELDIDQRVVYRGKTRHKNRIGTVKDFIDGKGKVGISFSDACTTFLPQTDLHPINADESIGDGVYITNLYARPIKNSESYYMPDEAIGKPFRIIECYGDFIALDTDNSKYYKTYYIGNEGYELVPRHMYGWVMKDMCLKREKLHVSHYNEYTLYWRGENGDTIKDQIVGDSITKGLDIARGFTNTNQISVVR